MPLRVQSELLRDENTMTAGTVSIPPALMPEGGRQGEKKAAVHEDHQYPVNDQVE